MTTFPLSPTRRAPAQHARPVILLAGSLSLVMALLVTAVTAAVGLGGLAGLGRLIGASPLDYARGPLGEFFPLSDSFVQDELGPSFGQSPTSAGPVPVGSGRAVAAPSTDRALGGSDSVPPPDEISADLGNDDFAKAYAVRGLPFSTRTTAPSTREPGEPVPCGPPGGSRWFKYAPRSNVGLVATTSGTELGSSIAVYTGSSLSNLTAVGCAGGPNNGGQVPFAASAGTTYWFQASKTIGDGLLVFTLDVQGRTILASMSDDDRPAGSDSSQPSISADGRFVVFRSRADLVPGTQNNCIAVNQPNPLAPANGPPPGPCYNIYVRDVVRGTTTLVSTRDGEVGGNHDSESPAISANGRFVVFRSTASNLVAQDTNGTSDVFLRDVAAQRTVMVTLTSDGEQVSVDEGADFLAASDDGRYVAFSSNAPELLREARGDVCDPSSCYAAFIRDVHMGRTHLVSVDKSGDAYGGDSTIGGLTPDGRYVTFNIHHEAENSRGQVVVSEWQRPGRSVVASAPDGKQPDDEDGEDDDEANGWSVCLIPRCLTSDGRYLVFNSWADNLVQNDTNGTFDFFVRDLHTKRTVMVSVTSAGQQGHPPTTSDPFALSSTSASVGYPSATIAPNGRFVVFSSDAPDLVPGDTNGTYDVFMHDLRRRTTTRVSLHTDGTQSNGLSYRAVVANGGRSIAFAGRGFEGEDTGTFAVYVRQQPAS